MCSILLVVVLRPVEYARTKSRLFLSFGTPGISALIIPHAKLIMDQILISVTSRLNSALYTVGCHMLTLKPSR
ncbi:hypothetical protein OHD25_01140 [Escherichia coli]|nr:hypothetical protein [Escherichia coli]